LGLSYYLAELIILESSSSGGRIREEIIVRRRLSSAKLQSAHQNWKWPDFDFAIRCPFSGITNNGLQEADEKTLGFPHVKREQVDPETVVYPSLGHFPEKGEMSLERYSRVNALQIFTDLAFDESCPLRIFCCQP
jgi:hypothetical protein